MSFSGKYTIQFKGLKDGFHLFEFDLNNKFFEFFNNQDVERGKLTARVNLERKPTLLELEVKIKGTVNVLCDRCLDFFDFPISYSGKLYVKFTNDAYSLEDPDVICLDPEDYQVDLAQYLYESVILSLPYKKVHPDVKKGAASCNPEMLEKLNKILIKENKETDPRWDKLKDLKKELN